MSELPPGWEWTTIGDLTVPVSKVDPRIEPACEFDYVDIGGVDGDRGEILQTQRLAGSEAPSRARQLIRAGDTVLSTVRTYMRKTALVPPRLDGQVASTGFSVLRPAEGVNPLFLYHSVRRQEFVDTLSSLQTGSSYPAVRDGDVRSMPVPFAPTAEQTRIVAAIEEHLSRLDAAEAVLDSAATKAAVLRRVALRDGFQLNAPVVALADVAQVVSGQTPKGLEAAENGSIPFFKVGDMNTADEGVLRRSRTMLSEEAIALLGLHLRPPGTVVFPKRGGAIATNKKRVLGCQAAFDLNTMGVIAGKDLDIPYLRWWFETLDLASLSDGSNVPQINHGDIAPLGIPVPPLDEQRRVVAALDAAEGHLMRLSRQVELARSRAGVLRRAILAAAFSGRLVPQCPGDEPASVLLERIRADRAAATPTKRTRKAKAT